MGTVLTRQTGTLRSVSTLRGLLILCLIAMQSAEVCGIGGRYADAVLWFAPTLAIAGLAGLAGFTMSRSLDRHGLKTFAARTIIRFVPSTLIVVFAIVAGGALLTAEGVRQYANDTDTAAYLLNIIGLYHASLPGVFEFNPDAETVNSFLRFMPVLYSGAPLVALSNITKYNKLASCMLFFALVGGYFLLPNRNGLDPERLGAIASLTSGQLLVSLGSLILGAISYSARKHIVMGWPIALVCAIVLLINLYIGGQDWFDDGVAGVICAISVVYLILYISRYPLPMRHQAPALDPLYWRILLFAFPVQQAWVQLGISQSPMLHFLLSLPTIIALSAIEWFLIEKPLLSRLGRGAIAQYLHISTVHMHIPKDPGFYRNHSRILGARLLVGLALVVVMLALFAMTMFAMQRETIGA